MGKLATLSLVDRLLWLLCVPRLLLSLGVRLLRVLRLLANDPELLIDLLTPLPTLALLNDGLLWLEWALLLLLLML